MHAGVLFALEHLGFRVTGISGVSGGAIIASYYVGGGEPEQFLHIVQGHELTLPREVTRFPTLLRLLGQGFTRCPGTDSSVRDSWSKTERGKFHPCRTANRRSNRGGQEFGCRIGCS
jgi:predicted acylesterase/phospholipase RssA